MSVKEIKISISKIIEQIDDPTLLEAYYEILKNVLKVHKSHVIGLDSDGEPLTMGSFENKINEAQIRMESGESISQKDLEDDFKNW